MPPELVELRLELLEQAADGLEIDVVEVGEIAHGAVFSGAGTRAAARQVITGSRASLRSSPASAAASLRSGIGYAPVKQAEQ
jgi:hypothetical protein